MVILQMKGRQFAEAVSDVVDQLTKFNGDEFSRLARDAHKVVMAAEKAGENSEEFIQKATEDFKARTRATFDEVGAEYGQLFGKAENPEGADDNLIAANQAYNEALEGVSQVAEGIAFGALDDRSMSQVAHESAMFRFLMSQGLPRVEQFASAQIAAWDNQIAELNEELSQYKAAQPSYSPTGNTKPIASTIEDMGHQDAARLIDFAAG